MIDNWMLKLWPPGTLNEQDLAVNGHSQKDQILVSKTNYHWASSQQNLSSGVPTKRDSNQYPQLQRLARI